MSPAAAAFVHKGDAALVIVDTTVWIDFLRGTANPETSWLDREIGRRPLGLTDLTLCEILQGVPSDAAFEQVLSDLLKFDVFDTGGSKIAMAAARNYRYLRQRGHTVRKTIDCLIATFCINGGHELLHRDRDFDSFEKYLGLMVIQPQQSRH